MALKFRGKQVPIKDVLHALENVRRVLSELGEKDALDYKLAEYAFFPLTHVFNEAQRLSSSCLEAAIKCVVLLASRGWRHRLSPDMGKQLLILMTFIGAPDPKKQAEPPSEELKEASLLCINAVVEQLSGRQDSKRLFNDLGAKSIVDQLAYMLLDAITEGESDRVQFAAANALQRIIAAISDRVLLASLLPRTASALTQVLKTSSKARRTGKVLRLYLEVLKTILEAVLADDVVYPLDDSPPDYTPSTSDQAAALNRSWLEATAAQVKLVLVQVTKLRDHDKAEVRQALSELCQMVARDCPKSLSGSLPVAVETLLLMSRLQGSATASLALQSLAKSDLNVAEIVRTKYQFLCQSLPRMLQGTDERPKVQSLRQIASSINILEGISLFQTEDLTTLIKALLFGLSERSSGAGQSKMLQEQTDSQSLAVLFSQQEVSSFQQLTLNQAHEKEVAVELNYLLSTCTANGLSNQMARICLNQLQGATHTVQTSGLWLALACMQTEAATENDFGSLIDFGDSETEHCRSRPQVISDIYATALPILLEDIEAEETSHRRLKALAVESTVLQAQQLRVAYRPELMDTCILSCLSLAPETKCSESMQ